MKSMFSNLTAAGFVVLAVSLPPALAETTAPVVAAVDVSAPAKSHPISEVHITKTELLAPVTGKGPAVLPAPETRPPIRNKVWTVVPPPEVVPDRKPPITTENEISPLGLPRLKAAREGGAPTLPAGSFDLDDLKPSPKAEGLARQEQDGIVWLEISPSRAWSRPLRGGRNDVEFVSFVINASPATLIKIGGAWLRVEADAQGKRAGISIARSGTRGGTWEPVKYGMAMGDFGGVQLAILPLVTVRLDPSAGVWDLYFGSLLVEEQWPLMDVSREVDRKFTVEAGGSGAWVCGVVVANENPLFEDANRNGLPDDTERAQLGALLTGSNAQRRSEVVKRWKTPDPYALTPIFRLSRPLPDRRPPPPEGGNAIISAQPRS